MRLIGTQVIMAVCVLVVGGGFVEAAPIGTSCTYQGHLTQEGVPVTGEVDLLFGVYDAPTAGNQVAPLVPADNVLVTGGLFAVDIDFGADVPADLQLWLAISVRCPAGTGGYITMDPRHPVRPVRTALSLRHLRTEDATDSPNVIGGHAENSVTDGVFGSVIAGGGKAGLANRVTDHYSVVGGGRQNLAGDDGGTLENADYATVAGGAGNRAEGSWSAIGGGKENVVSGNLAAIGGGSDNEASATYSAVAGGWDNAANAFAASVGGGHANEVAGQYAVVGGGRGNRATAESATVPGGRNNRAEGAFSLAAGNSARALHDGTFVWADADGTPVLSTGVNQFLIRAAGGVGIGTTAPTAPLTVVVPATQDAAVRAESDDTVGELGHRLAGVMGTDRSAGHHGQLGAATAGVAGFAGEGSVGSGVIGESESGAGVAGTSVHEAGVLGMSDSMGVKGVAIGTLGTTYGVYGENRTVHGAGVCGESFRAAQNSPGVLGIHDQDDGWGTGVLGRAGNTGVRGEVDVEVDSGTHRGVHGEATGGTGINQGVYGRAAYGQGTNIGVYAIAGASDEFSTAIMAIAGNSDNVAAGFFDGIVNVNGLLTKSSGAFKIDHPLDPDNKFLYHSFVESPDMMNVYNGNVVTDENGGAVVTLPDWFESVNRDYRYQLTVIGQFAQAIVAEEMSDNRFAIRTDQPRVKVSWQVTGIRKDPWAAANPIPVEQVKKKHERGRYLHPEVLGKPAHTRLHHELHEVEVGNRVQRTTEQKTTPGPA